MKSLVVLSGGQDSVTTFFMAKETTEVIGLVHFDYNQKHGSPELACCKELSKRFKVPLHVIYVDDLLQQVGDSALLMTSDEDMNEPHPILKGVPATFVPGRNLIFLTLAGALALKLGAAQIWTGVCQTDYSGYPDCRSETITALEIALNYGFGTQLGELQIIPPLMDMTKAQTFAEAQRLGVLDYVIENTHTCYNGDHTTRYEWGYGCGSCPACKIRRKGYNEFRGITDDDN